MGEALAFVDYGDESVDEILSSASLDGAGTLTQQVYRLIWNLVVDLRLRPNQYLSEKDVALALNVSRSPVREAFIRLSEDGLLNVVPKSGNYVSPIDVNRAFEGYLIRSSMESTCLALLAERSDPDCIRALRKELAAQEKCAAKKDDAGFLALDRRFHDLFFVIANLPNIKRMVDEAKFEVDRIKNLRKLYRRGPRLLASLVSEHREMVDAVAAGDGERARRAIAGHFSGMSKSLETIAKEERLWGMFHTINRGAKTGRRGRQAALAAPV